MAETKADIRGEIRELLGATRSPGTGQFRSRVLEKAVEALGLDPWGGAPSHRTQIRRELGFIEASENDGAPLRKAELNELREELQEAIASPEDRAVSPVIGVILMVAITVILAAVIGTFVLDLGQAAGSGAPTASLGVEDAGATWKDAGGMADFLVIEHQSGEDLDVDELRIVVRNASSNEIVAEFENGETVAGPPTGDANDVQFLLNSNTIQTSDSIVVGDIVTVRVDESVANQQAGYEYSVTIVATGSDSRVATGTVEVQ